MAASSAKAALSEVAEKAPDSAVEAATRALQTSRTPTAAAFVARALNAVAKLASEVDQATLGNAAGETSDYSALLRVLETPDALAALKREDSLIAARLRGLRSREMLASLEGGVVSADEAAALLGLTRQAVDKRRRAGHLLAVSTGRRGYRYPIWQFASEGVLPGLEATLDQLRDHDPWMQLAFFLNASTWLGGETPLAALRQGRVDAVLRAARAYGEQSAA